MEETRIYDFDVKENLALQSQIKYLEAHVKGLMKIISDTHICQPLKILVCAGCGKEFDKLKANNTKPTQTGSQEADVAQAIERYRTKHHLG